MTHNQKILFRILFLLYLTGVLYLCFGRFDNAPSVEWSLFGIPTDKLVHFCMFFPFPILAFLAFDRYTETVRQTLTFVGVTLAVGLLLAVGTEWGQAHFTDYRSADPWDFVADTSALVVSSILVSIWDIRKQKK